MSESCIGARVRYCGHDDTFVADVFKVGNCNVVRASRTPLDAPGFNDMLERSAMGATHHLVDYPDMGFWRPDLGVFVVPEEQVTEL